MSLFPITQNSFEFCTNDLSLVDSSDCYIGALELGSAQNLKFLRVLVAPSIIVTKKKQNLK